MSTSAYPPYLPPLDADLTSRYAPSYAGSSSSGRHPTGDSPPPASAFRLSRRSSASSSNASTANSRSRIGLGEAGSEAGSGEGAGGGRGMPNLSSLLCLLSESEDEGEGASQARASQGVRNVAAQTPRHSTETILTSQNEKQADHLVLSGDIPSSSTPRKLQPRSDSFYRNRPDRDDHYDQTFAPHSHSPTSASGPHGSLNYTSLPTDSFTLNPIPPRSTASTPSAAGVVPTRSPHAPDTVGRYVPEFQTHQSEAEATNYDGNTQGSIPGRTTPNAKAIANEVLAEFSAIVSTPRQEPTHFYSDSYNPHGSPTSPASLTADAHVRADAHTHLRSPPAPASPHFPPPRLTQPPTLDPPTLDPPAHDRHDVHRPTPAHASPSLSNNASAFASGPAAPTAAEAALVAELRAAQAQVGKLQGELVELRGMVLMLRDDERRNPLQNSLLRPPYRSAPPPARDAPPKLDSVHRALAFVRSVDALAHRLPPGQLRCEEDVFLRENLEAALRRVQGWEAVARGTEPRMAAAGVTD